MKNKKFLWRCCVVAVIAIILITFSPLIIKTGKIKPDLFGLPFTLWAGILLTVALVALTYLGGLVLPFEEEDKK